MKSSFTLIFLFTFSLSFSPLLSQLHTLQCEFLNALSFEAIDKVYECYVKNDPKITSSTSSVIESATGHHYEGMTNTNVTGVTIRDKIVTFFPKNLEKVFGDLNLILINNCGLKEIHQSDLKPFRNLINLNLFKNSIAIIENNLFEFNLNLQVFIANKNKIKFVSPNVFDKLHRLNFLSISDCVSKKVKNDRFEVLKLIREIDESCKDQEKLLESYKNLGDKLIKVEQENSKNLEDFQRNLEKSHENVQKLHQNLRNKEEEIQFHKNEVERIKEISKKLTPKIQLLQSKSATAGIIAIIMTFLFLISSVGFLLWKFMWSKKSCVLHEENKINDESIQIEMTESEQGIVNKNYDFSK